jgi:hypothetical protein
VSKVVSSKFQAGDRVAVYLDPDRPPYRGVVLRAEQALLKVKRDLAQCPGPTSPPDVLVVHPKQCRRLKPTDRRRVWIPEWTLREGHEPKAYLSPTHISPAQRVIEFIEVKKPKGVSE